MIKNPRSIIIDEEVYSDVIDLLNDDTWKYPGYQSHLPTIKINKIELLKHHSEWTYCINFDQKFNHEEKSRNMILYKPGYKLVQYLDNYLIRLEREKIITELGI